MSTGLHRDIEIVEIHRTHSLSYANAAARTGATGLTADDVGRDAIQNHKDMEKLATGVDLEGYAHDV